MQQGYRKHLIFTSVFTLNIREYLLVTGAFAVLKQARAHPEKYPWVAQLLARKPAKVVALALANMMARVAWAVLAKKEIYRERQIAVTPASV